MINDSTTRPCRNNSDSHLDDLAKLLGSTSSQKVRDDYRDLARKNASGKTAAELEEYLKQFN